ncbi:hypothetical protein [Priestia koreensis]|uniref:Uncharacterized protein n=1 Tax=Priestia koreensis TaxID=284581 RepID=A0A0M0L590_9BACI|nr:hypothetical protein [Priestia koreensis]KOO46017.1 hypothetical protein AMD01_09045 [Priestia koreensis]MCM3004022.1 hypothetical protein [Priestia koreensis]
MTDKVRRVIWIIPNVFCYLMVIGLIVFITANAEGLYSENRLEIWVFFSMLLLAVSIFGSYRIWKWMRDGKL